MNNAKKTESLEFLIKSITTYVDSVSSNSVHGYIYKLEQRPS